MITEPERLIVQTSDVLKKTLASEFLTKTELVRYARVPLQKQPDWLLGRLVAKQTITSALADRGVTVTLTDIEMYSEPSGAPAYHLLTKPSGYSDNAWPISLSHCTGVAAACLRSDQKPVGIDIEQIRTWSMETLKAFTTPREYQHLRTLPPTEQNHLATVLWTIKEATLKALKTGLRRHPNTIETILDQPEIMLYRPDEERSAVLKPRWLLYNQNYIITVVTL